MLHKHTLHYILTLWAKITFKNVRKVLNFALEIGKFTAINQKKTYQSRLFLMTKLHVSRSLASVISQKHLFELSTFWGICILQTMAFDKNLMNSQD